MKCVHCEDDLPEVTDDCLIAQRDAALAALDDFRGHTRSLLRWFRSTGSLIEEKVRIEAEAALSKASPSTTHLVDERDAALAALGELRAFLEGELNGRLHHITELRAILSKPSPSTERVKAAMELAKAAEKISDWMEGNACDLHIHNDMFLELVNTTATYRSACAAEAAAPPPKRNVAVGNSKNLYRHPKQRKAAERGQKERK